MQEIYFAFGIILNYRWIFNTENHTEAVSELADNLEIPTAVAKVLAYRGINNIDLASQFFKPAVNNLHNPFLMKDMQQAVERILQGIENNELFWLHGDYDVDGTMSVAMMYLFLKEIGAKVEYFIPDRLQVHSEHNFQSIKSAVQNGASVLITIDVGTNSFEMLDLAFQNKIDTIVCDHHKPNGTLPVSHSILNPFRVDCPYPFKPLAACGVAFKLIQALSATLKQPDLPWKYLDLVAISSSADMVPLLGENRILLALGLKQINEDARLGIKSLIYCAGLTQGTITTSNIIYSIAPLINVAGRMGKASRAVKMMTTNSEVKALQIAQELEDENRKRRILDQNLFEEVIPIAEQQMQHGRHSLIIYGEDWHPGVIGIVAARLVDRYQLPVVLLTKTDNNAHGSARCMHNFDIYETLKQCENLLVEFGGHKHAAGITIEANNIDKFSEKFDQMVKSNSNGRLFMPELQIDTELNFADISIDLFNFIDKFSPFGLANPKPLFLTKDVVSVNSIKPIGLNKIKFRAMQNNRIIDAIWQNFNQKLKFIQSGKPFSIIYNLETHVLNRQPTLQLAIKDIRESC